MKLSTERLIIREYQEHDIRDLHNILTNHRVMALMPEISSSSLDESYRTLYDAILESKLIHRKKFFFAITDKVTGAYIGEIGYLVLFDTLEGKVVNLGYFISPEHWGKGYVTEAARELVRYMFEEQNVIKIEAGCLSENVGSISVMEKIGMTQESYMKKHMYYNNRLHDRVDYRLLLSEWESKKE